MNSALFGKVIEFIHSIGIETEFRTLPATDCFLPGLLIEGGRIIIDREQLKYPGDIIHEAAHIAVVPAQQRKDLSGVALGSRSDAPAEEMMAIAWSYAACLHLDMDPHFVFHEHGYKGGGASLVQNFREGNYIGVPMLQWLGMTTTSRESNIVYPAMMKWVRD
jgi:hypothetical protein